MHVNRCFHVALIVTALSTAASWAQGPVSLIREADAQGTPLITVENDWYRLSFVEDPGGWCVSFRMPKDGPDWLPQAQTYRQGGRLFVHNLTGGHWGGRSFATEPRTITVETESPDQVELLLVAPGGDFPRLEQRMTFSAASPVITVDLALINISAQGMVQGLWPHFLFYPGGDREWNAFLKPGVHGVTRFGWDPAAGRNEGDNDFMRNPVEGWIATLNERLGLGMVFVMDYNDLNVLYNSLPYWTTEWFYDGAPLRGNGGAWRTRYYAFPTEGFHAVASASESLVAEHPIRPGANGLELTTGVAALARPLREARLHVRWTTLIDPAEPVDLPAQTFRDLNHVRQANTVPLPGAPAGRSLVLAVEWQGTDTDGNAFTHAYTHLHAEDDAMQFDLIAGEAIPMFRRDPPRKVKVFDKPAHLRVMPRPGAPLLELRGPGYYRTKVPQAATLADILDIKGSWFRRDFNGNAVTYFPIDYDELLEFNVIALNNVDAYCLEPFGREMVVDFVRAGGGLLVFGGPFSLSNGQYHETQYADILPVTLSGEAFSLQPVSGNDRTLARGPDSRILEAVDIPAGMECYWMETVEPKADAWVELTVGGVPFLICGEVKGPHATGRVAVIAGSVLGDGDAGFYDHPAWPEILSHVMNWLNYGARIDWSNQFRRDDP